jgi:integrase
MARFTDFRVKNLKPRDKRYEVREADGFGMWVYPSSRKSWVYTYHLDGGKERHILGEYPDMTLGEAREAHSSARKLVRMGVSPKEVERAKKAEARDALTVTKLIAEYIEKWAMPRKRSWEEDERQLKKDVIPSWGKRKAKDIKRRDVQLLIESVEGRGAPIAANRLLAVVRRMFNFAVERDIVEHSPCVGIKPVAKENRKDRVLTGGEIRELWLKLDTPIKAEVEESEDDDDKDELLAMSAEVRKILKLMLVTAQRPSEVAGLNWDEVDGQWWTIPPERSKNGFAHRVPLSKLALDVLGRRSEGFVFPSPRKGVDHIHVNALAHAVRANQEKLGTEPFTPHDLRRTAASHMTGAGIPRLVVSKILNHVEPGVTAVYDRHSYDIEKRQALDSWARKLTVIIEGKEGGEVIPFISSETT